MFSLETKRPKKQYYWFIWKWFLIVNQPLAQPHWALQVVSGYARGDHRLWIHVLLAESSSCVVDHQSSQMSGEMGLQRQRCALETKVCGLGFWWLWLAVPSFKCGWMEFRGLRVIRMIFFMIGLGGWICGWLRGALGITPLRKSEGSQQVSLYDLKRP